MLPVEGILIVLSFTLCINQLLAAQISGLYSKQCDYLKITRTQNFNAYTDSGKLCCLCQAGTKFVDHCNSTHPSSTICEICAPNTYREYSGHMNTDCEFDAGIACFPPFVAVPGTSIKKASCGCPPGLVKDGNSCIEDNTVPTIPSPPKIPLKPSPSPPAQASTISQVSTKTSRSITQYGDQPELPKQTETPATEDMKVNTDANREGMNGRSTGKSDNVHQNEINRSMSKDETYMEKDREWIIPTVLLGAVVLFAAVGIIYLKSRAEQTTSTAKDNVSVESSAQSSPDGSRDALISTSRQDHISDRVVETSPAGNEAELIRQEIPVRACVPEQQNEETQLLSNPAQDRHERIENDNVSPDCFHSYAKEIGNAFRNNLKRNDVSPFYRHLGLDDVVLDDMESEYEHNTPERIYKLTMHVYRKLGSGFTKKFLINKVHTMICPQRNLLPIIEDEWVKCQRRFNLN